MGDIERAQEPYDPDMSDTAVHIALLETERDGLRLNVGNLERQLAEARTEIDRLNSQVAEWSKANLTIVAKCVDLERRLAATVEERDCWKDGGETLAMQVKDLQREVDQWVTNSAVWQRRLAALTAALTTRRSACNEESERADLAERQLAEARDRHAVTEREACACATAYGELEAQLAQVRKALNRIARGTEVQARVMRDPIRIGGWAGAERVAEAFDDIAERARAALQEKGPPG